MLDDALTLGALGWNIFPLVGKIPLTKHGFKEATSDERTIWEWWQRWPDANIGLALPPGILVIDIDPRAGGTDELAKLTNIHGAIPETRTVISGREDGGCHFYLIRPPGTITGRRLPPGIDHREGGKSYVVAPPSIHPATGRPYRWANEAEFALCPRWLTDLLRPVIEPPRAPVTRKGDAGAGLIRHVTDLQVGNRNHGFFWACCTAISEGLWPSIKEDLKIAARSTGLTDHEIEATAASAERRVA